MDFKPRPNNLPVNNANNRPMPSVPSANSGLSAQPGSMAQRPSGVVQSAGQSMTVQPNPAQRPQVNSVSSQSTMSGSAAASMAQRPDSAHAVSNHGASTSLTNINPSPAPVSNPVMITGAPAPTTEMSGPNSSFSMSALELFGYELMMVFGSMLTFGIAAPWLYCFKLKNMASATVVNGRRLEFNGRGGELFIKGLKWFFLSMLTFGIYSIWARRNFLAWVAENTTNA